MASITVNDRVQETTTTSGTSTLTLLGAVADFQSFSSGITVGLSTYYCVTDNVSNWEVGIGTVASTNTLTRDTVITSSNANALVNFSSGTKYVFCTLPATITPSPAMTPQSFVNTHSTTIANNQTISSGVLAGPVSITGTVSVSGNLVVV
jgi:hypothetical protein